ncbi:MAG: response regulator [Nitrospinae bacterium]|nr:response regulator [Nitrospinota bacterium]MBF0634510.1 response regulator [Nitrospinota bacterium]
MEAAVTQKRDVILVAEDNLDDMEMIREAFAEAVGDGGYELLLASNGEEALEILLQRSLPSGRDEGPLPSLVMLDLDMPRMNGVDVIKAIRSTRRLRRVPVLVLSTSTAFPDIDRCYCAGANSYLVKPHTISELADLLKTTLAYWFGVARQPSKSRGDCNGQ